MGWDFQLMIASNGVHTGKIRGYPRIPIKKEIPSGKLNIRAYGYEYVEENKPRSNISTFFFLFLR